MTAFMTIYRAGMSTGVAVFLALILVLPGFAAARTEVSEDPVIEETFQPGLGNPIGEVQLVQGTVLVFHADDPELAYVIRQGLPLFKGDTLVTREDGKVNFELNDGSTVTLATDTLLTLNESIYDEEGQQSRLSFISLGIGKIRCLVRKLTGFRETDFKVKTKTAIVGVRGSDFVVETREDFTRVTALEDTLLGVVSLTAPCEEEITDITDCEVKAVLLSDFEQALVEAGDLPTVVDTLPPEQIEMMIQEFMFEGAEGQLAREQDVDVDYQGVRVGEDQLVPPEMAGDDLGDRTDVPDIIQAQQEIGQTGAALEQVDQVMEVLQEDNLLDNISELPFFPDPPENEPLPQ